MIKKIKVDALRKGMYIHDLNCDWMSHAFHRSHFVLRTGAQFEMVRELGVAEVYIDTDLGLDAPDAPTAREVVADLDRELVQVAQQTAPPSHARSLHEEMARAREVHSAAHREIKRILETVRLGKPVELGPVEELVDQIGVSLMANRGALLSLCRIRNADEYTFLHSVSVGTLMTAFTGFSELDSDTVRRAGLGGLVHDIGKMKTPLPILNKPDRLTPREFEVMRRHASDGHALLQDVRGISEEQLRVTLQHHERLDGSGYPYGLKAEQIDPLAQMAAIVDVYDALTAERCYHRAMAPTEALRKLLEWSKHHFNASFVHAFIRCVGIYPVGSAVMMESGRLAIVIEPNEINLLTPTVLAVYDTRQQHFIVPPLRIDLARPLGYGGGDRILTAVDPEPWGINPREFLISLA